MKAASVHQLKQELVHHSSNELIEYCLRLAKFKKENKELLSYLLFESHDEEGYIASVKAELDEQFEDINRRNYYFIKKSIRKILRHVRKFIRYSKKNETEVELMLYFCHKLKEFSPSIKYNVALTNLFKRQVTSIRKAILLLEEDLQYDYGIELDEILK